MPRIGRAVTASEPYLARVAPLAIALYLGTLIVILDQVSQIGLTLGSITPTAPTWRFQASTMLSGRIAPILVSMLVTVGAAVGAKHRGWLKAQGLAGLLLALMLVGALASLWLDGPAVRPTVPGTQINSFTAQWVRGLVMSAIGALAFAALGLRLLTAR